MSNILIPTSIYDHHARIATIALRQQGHQVTRWFGADCPQFQHQTIHVNQSNFSLNVKDEFGLDFDSHQFDTIWYRRPEPSSLPENVHEADKLSIQISWKQHFISSWFCFKDDIFWVNPFTSYDKSNSKPLQLKIAQQVGLSIPTTIFSNDPIAVRKFASESANGIVFKSLNVAEWVGKGKPVITRTVKIELDQLQDDAAITMAPGIFQERVFAAYEVRATFFGQTCIAVKIAAKNGGFNNKIDWRSIPRTELALEEIELPDVVQQRCIALMRKLDIVFGCIDFMVTASGDFVFIEINEMGQFLWVEDALPSAKMLATFCDFITAKDKNYNRPAQTTGITLREITQSEEFKNISEEDKIRHVDSARAPIYKE